MFILFIILLLFIFVFVFEFIFVLGIFVIGVLLFIFTGFDDIGARRLWLGFVLVFVDNNFFIRLSFSFSFGLSLFDSLFIVISLKPWLIPP